MLASAPIRRRWFRATDPAGWYARAKSRGASGVVATVHWRIVAWALASLARLGVAPHDRLVMLADLHADSFAPYVGSRFELDDDGPARPDGLTLAEVQPYGSRSHGARHDPFGLVFVGPAAPILDQRIHRLRHPDLGVLEIFLVPIGPGPDGQQRYEAIFN